MRRRVQIGLLIAVAFAGAAAAQTFQSWVGPANEQLPGMVIACPTGSGRQAAPCGTTGNPLQVTSAPSSSQTGGLSVYRVMSPAGTPGMPVKPSAGRLYSFNLCNTAGSARYVRFYDNAAPVVGTTPVYAGAIVISAGSCQQFTTSFGLAFSAGIGMSVTAANGDGDATAPAAGDVSGFLGYQ